MSGNDECVWESTGGNEEVELTKAKTRLLSVQADVMEYNWRWEQAKDARRVYNMIGGIDDAEEYNFRSTLTRWLDYDADDKIVVVINSGGGNVSSGFAIYDWTESIKAQGADITTKCLGMAASMATLMLQLGGRRMASKNSLVMIHDISIERKGSMTSAQVRDQAELLGVMNDRYVQELASKSRLTEEQIQANIDRRKDWWLTADLALEAGFIDEIGF